MSVGSLVVFLLVMSFSGCIAPDQSPNDEFAFTAHAFRVPAAWYSGVRVGIDVNVSNEGRIGASETVCANVQGQDVECKLFTLAPGQTRSETFSFLLGAIGPSKLRVLDLEIPLEITEVPKIGDTIKGRFVDITFVDLAIDDAGFDWTFRVNWHNETQSVEVNDPFDRCVFRYDDAPVEVTCREERNRINSYRPGRHIEFRISEVTVTGPGSATGSPTELSKFIWLIPTEDELAANRST